MEKISKLKPKSYFYLALIFLISLMTTQVLFAWQILEQIDDLAVEKYRERQKVLLRSGANSIAHFFKDIEVEACLLAENRNINSGDIELIEKELIHFTQHLRDRLGAVSGVVLVSKDGYVVTGVDIEGNVRRQSPQQLSVSDRDYFLWASQQKNLHATYLLKPIIARGGDYSGELISGVAVPLIEEDGFNGLILINIPVEKLASNFIMPLVDTLTGDIFLIAEDGAIISATRNELRGKNFNECLESGAVNQLGGRVQSVTSLLGKGEGEFSYYCHHGHWDKNDELIAMFNVTQAGQENMVLLVNVPKNEIEASFQPLRNASVQVQYVGITFVLLILSAIVFWTRANQKSAFVNGYKMARKKSSEKKKKN